MAPRGSALALLGLLLAACGGSTFSTGSSNDGGPSSSGGGPGVGGAPGGHPGTGGLAAGGLPSNGGTAAGGLGGASGGLSGTGGVAGSAGSVSTTQLASNYDQNCQFDSECALVSEGDVCACLDCANAAIAKQAQSLWDADRSAIVCAGPPLPCPARRCANMLAACAAGTCSIRAPKIIDATQYDQSCQSDTDCIVIVTGEVCSVCKCQAGAINQSALPVYEKDIATEQCNPGPSPCDCAAPGVAHCALPPDGPGTCVLG